MKTFDCFLFFDELDLLEIRLSYLYDNVDYFVIVESEITFQGNIKGFIFEQNKQRFEKYLAKIIYYKIEKYELDFTNLPVIENPKNLDEIVLNKIYRLVENADDFDKKQFWFGNDNFQRESIWRALATQLPDDSDLILLSDADEIIRIEALKEIQSNISEDEIYSCKQHEFYYFMNYFHNSNWFGQTCFLFGSFKYQALNKLRSFRTSKNSNYSVTIMENGGWHFTSMGDIKKIENKINSWGHKEFNNKIIRSALKYNITHGYDIFRRKNFGRLYFISPNDKMLIDLLGNNSIKYHHLFGPRIKDEFWLKKIINSFYFKIVLRLNSILFKQ